MTYQEHLRHVRIHTLSDQQRMVATLCNNCPTTATLVNGWPLGMPASLDPKLVIIGASPGDSPKPGHTGAVSDYGECLPTVNPSLNSDFYYEDSRKYWKKIRYLLLAFCNRERSIESLPDAIALTSHLNLSTIANGQAGVEGIEPDVVRWVSRLLNNKHSPDLVVLVGLKKIMLDDKQNRVINWWNCKGGLLVNWKQPEESPLLGTSLSFREWMATNAAGHRVRIVMWPNHPSRVPFGSIQIWNQTVDQFLSAGD